MSRGTCEGVERKQGQEGGRREGQRIELLVGTAVCGEARG